MSKSRTTVAASWLDARPLALLGTEKGAGSSPSVSFFHELLDFPALPKFVLAQSPKAGKPSTMNSVTLNLREVVKAMTKSRGFDRILGKVWEAKPWLLMKGKKAPCLVPL